MRLITRGRKTEKNIEEEFKNDGLSIGMNFADQCRLLALVRLPPGRGEYGHPHMLRMLADFNFCVSLSLMAYVMYMFFGNGFICIILQNHCKLFQSKQTSEILAVIDVIILCSQCQAYETTITHYYEPQPLQ